LDESFQVSQYLDESFQVSQDLDESFQVPKTWMWLALPKVDMDWQMKRGSMVC
jgi:hypothetical protein